MVSSTDLRCEVEDEGECSCAESESETDTSGKSDSNGDSGLDKSNKENMIMQFKQ